MNKIIIMGNVGKQPELKHTAKNAKYCNISVAVNRVSHGEKSTQWFNVTCWNKTAEYVVKYVAKGSRIIVEGRLESHEGLDSRNGQNREFWVITASHVHGLGKAEREPQEVDHNDMEDRQAVDDIGNVKETVVDEGFAADEMPF